MINLYTFLSSCKHRHSLTCSHCRVSELAVLPMEVLYTAECELAVLPMEVLYTAECELAVLPMEVLYTAECLAILLQLGLYSVIAFTMTHNVVST